MVEIYNLFEYKYDFLIRLIKNLVAYDNSIPKPTKLTMYIMNLYSILSENFSENVISKTVIKLHKYNIIFEPNIAKIEKFHFSVEKYYRKYNYKNESVGTNKSIHYIRRDYNSNHENIIPYIIFYSH